MQQILTHSVLTAQPFSLRHIFPPGNLLGLCCPLCSSLCAPKFLPSEAQGLFLLPTLPNSHPKPCTRGFLTAQEHSRPFHNPTHAWFPSGKAPPLPEDHSCLEEASQPLLGLHTIKFRINGRQVHKICTVPCSLKKLIGGDDGPKWFARGIV